MKLSGKVVLITGASEGIGLACARELARRGCKLIITARSADKLARVAQETGALAIPGDVTNPADRAGVVQTALDRFGQIDILINNAGVGVYAPSHMSDMASVRAMFDINFFAALEMIQLVTPSMKQRRDGLIVNVSSIAGLVALPWFSTYSATKFALCALTDGLRLELAPFDVRTMAVCPGYVKTAFSKNVLSGEAPQRLWRNRRFSITPEECAQAIAAGIERESRTVVTPRIGWMLVWVRRLAPRLADFILGRIYRGLGMA